MRVLVVGMCKYVLNKLEVKEIVLERGSWCSFEIVGYDYLWILKDRIVILESKIINIGNRYKSVINRGFLNNVFEENVWMCFRNKV